jgi:hypothetical protein
MVDASLRLVSVELDSRIEVLFENVQFLNLAAKCDRYVMHVRF